MQDQFSRTRLLLGSDAVDRLLHCRVAVFGLGGVGGAAVEALARAGVGALDLIDNDTVALSNLNRQTVATHETLGRYKTDAAMERVLSINPDCKVTVHRTFYMPENAGDFDFRDYDYVIDAIDTVSAKLSLIEQADAAGVPIISAMGAGNKTAPTAFRVADIYKTSVCPLARVIRTECRKRGIKHLRVVYSEEKPLSPRSPECAESKGTAGRPSPGSAPFVPPVVGMIAAGEVILSLIKTGEKSDGNNPGRA